MEHVARALGRPPEEIREKNLYASRGATTHYKQVASRLCLFKAHVSRKAFDRH
jgi:xanthine dehydrogenase molybdopterin-binding subunit B